MPIKKEPLSPTSTKLTISADQAHITQLKNEVLTRLSKNMKIAGFRPGKAPLSIIERQADSSLLQTEFLETAVNHLYADAIQGENLRPVQQPTISIQKFVPFTTLEFTAEIEVIGEVTLPDYKKIKLAKKPVAITAKEIDDVVHSLQLRMAERKDVTRAAKSGDQVTIDFVGKDAKTNELVNGADGKAYPLILGSNTFIPGFEENVVGIKAGEQKSFTITFPKDYGVKALQNRHVTFEVTATKVEELTEPKADDTFASKAGPFKTLQALRDDVKQQLESEKQAEADQAFDNELLEKIAKDTTVAIPDSLIQEELDRGEQQLRQNIAYRGQTWQEYLNELGQTEEAYRASLRVPAEMRVRAGLALSEIADREQIIVAPEELELRMQLLRGQYTDATMQAELDKPENRRSIMSRMLSEKTMARLAEYAATKPPAKK